MEFLEVKIKAKKSLAKMIEALHVLADLNIENPQGKND